MFQTYNKNAITEIWRDEEKLANEPRTDETQDHI